MGLILEAHALTLATDCFKQLSSSSMMITWGNHFLGKEFCQMSEVFKAQFPDDNCRRRFLSNDDGNSEQESATDVMTRSSLDRELIKTAAKVAPTRPNKRTI
ncbi:unnamed protein product, partial [Brugia timori]|uniref:Uncharacterized protein n=1 Tax=Brugia timori TaxID=42155 RepID=A0A0R3QCI4_9BILA